VLLRQHLKQTLPDPNYRAEFLRALLRQVQQGTLPAEVA
jgi:hypothetical protein